MILNTYKDMKISKFEECDMQRQWYSLYHIQHVNLFQH